MTPVKFLVRRTNPRSRNPYRIVRVVTWPGGRERTHKLLSKFETRDAAQAALRDWTDQGLIERLA